MASPKIRLAIGLYSLTLTGAFLCLQHLVVIISRTVVCQLWPTEMRQGEIMVSRKERKMCDGSHQLSRIGAGSFLFEVIAFFI